MDHVQHPDQIQLNNPWPALSTQHVNPEDNNPRVEQTPTVEAAPLYGERDALSPCSQNFEQNNHIPFYAYSMSTGLPTDVAVSKYWLRSVPANDALR